MDNFPNMTALKGQTWKTKEKMMIKRIKLWWAFQMVAFVALICPKAALEGLTKTFKEVEIEKSNRSIGGKGEL